MTRYLTSPPHWWQWPTVLSLDAPMVCLLWQALIARTVSQDLEWSHVFVLGASVWLAYVADRWIEGWRLDQRLVRTQRHLFYQRRRWPVAAAWTAVLTIDIVVAVSRLDRHALERGVVLMGPVLAYLLSHQLWHRNHRWRAPKEVIVAGLLTAGVAVFVMPSRSVSTLLLALVTFAGISFTNCALISCWERDVDLAHDQTSLARDSVQTAGLIKALPWAMAIGFGLIALGDAPARLAVGSGAVSALLLGLIDHAEGRIGWPPARVLADVALMTPILPLLWLALA